MGRLKKDITPEEKAERQRLYSKKYYWKNKERIDERVRENYRRIKKQKNMNNNLLTEIKHPKTDVEEIKLVKHGIETGLITEGKLRLALDKGWITKDEYELALTKLK